MIDPTVRYEIPINQPQEVNKEKQSIYQLCGNYLKEKII